MTKTILTIITMFTIIPTYATTMCAADDTVAIVIDPNIPKTNAGADDTGWWTIYQYGRVSGISACLNAGSYNRSNVFTDVKDENVVNVTGSERYGAQCWCKMIHPITSKWQRINYGNTISWCSSKCAGACAGSVYWGGNIFPSMVNSIE